MRFLWVIVFTFFTVFRASESEKILGIFTVPSKSHSILAYELFKELVKSGHEVTVISPIGNELKNPPKNYTNIVVGEEIAHQFRGKFKLHCPEECLLSSSLFQDTLDKMFDEVDVSPALKFNEMLNNTITLTNYVITHPDVQKLLKSSAKFDLVISELALNEAVLGFSEHYKCPHIFISTVGATSWVTTITSNPSPNSYIPHAFLDMTDRMSLVERLQNTVFHVIEDVLMNLFFYGKQQEIYETAFPTSKTFRPFWDKVKHGVSMIFLNSHFTLSYPRPYLPNLIEVGGMHIKKNTNPLPKDIQKFIDESEHGVVYFSLGGNLNPSVMPIEKQKAIIDALSKLKENVLWKWDDLNAKVDRKKFLVQKWFPQDDILAHPKVKLFITHGGLLGGTEAVYYAKPLVTIPIFGDQKLNAARSVLSGYGVRVDYSNLTESSLDWALNEVLNNQKYTKRVQELSKVFKDKPQHPVDLARFYVDYVIRNKGAPFMQSSSTYLNFIQLNNLDVYAIIAFIFILAIYIPYFVLKKLLTSIFAVNRTPAKQKKIKRN